MLFVEVDLIQVLFFWVHVLVRVEDCSRSEFMSIFVLNFFFISLKLIIQMLAFYNVNKKYFRQKHYADVAFFCC